MLEIGWAKCSITPDKPVMLCGQMHVRVSEGVENPIIVTALALENDGQSVIFVACDLVHITEELLAETRERLKILQPAFDPSCLILHATHTHTSMVYEEGAYNLPEGSGALTPAECRALIAEQAAAAAFAAWDGRLPGSVARGLGHAVVGHNRRACYLDGTARMYGATDTPDFSHSRGLRGS